MPIKNLTLGLTLLLAGTALAQNEPYRIKQGDTLSGLSERFHVRTASIVSYNGLDRHKALKVGHVITIANATVYSDRRSAKAVPTSRGAYVVHEGDHDVKIAKKHGLTLGQLHALNPGVNWRTLQPGQHLRVTRTEGLVATKAAKASSKKVPTGAAYTVREGDNDWIIAHRTGVTTVALRRMNPGVNLSRIQPGQKIRVPGSAVVAKAAAPKLHSRYAVIAGDAVTIRRGANRGSESIAQVDGGTRVVVLDRDGDWYRLRFPKGTEGWVRGDFLKAAAAPKAVRVAKHEAPRPHVAKAEAPVRVASHKKRKAPVERVVPQEFTQTVVAYQKSSNGSKASPDEILQKAKTFSGVRYRWGAMSRSATDCSGFTSQVFRSQGYKIPRTSSEQATTGIPVHAKDLKPGDLVFFHTRRGARVTHVGIYMGNGKFIHASSGGGKVQVNSLADGYYHKRLVAARRVAKGSAAAKQASKAEEPVAEPITPESDPANGGN